MKKDFVGIGKKSGLTNRVLVGLSVMSFLMPLGGHALAAEATDEFRLDPMVVTAQRIETREIDTPATVEVVTAQQIEEAGYKNVFDAIDNQLGISSTGYGDAGQDFGWSSGRTIIRGYDRGTLVMVNGMPVNLKNYNTADVVPVDMVDRIEIIKGAASTLYGAEAMGGVVNIITKMPDKEFLKVKMTAGNYYNDYGVSYGDKDTILSFSRSYNDEYNDSNAYPDGSDTKWWIGKGKTNRAAGSFKLSDELNFDIFYNDSDIKRGGYKKTKKYDYKYEGEKVNTALRYAGLDNGFKASIAYNYRKDHGTDYLSSRQDKQVTSNSHMHSYIVDLQQEWDVNETDKLIAGYTYKRENYQNAVNDSQAAHMIDNGVYLSYDKAFNDRFNMIIGLRGDRFVASANDADKNVFLPQLQTNYKLNDNANWYINIGKAYQMPAVDSYYGSGSFRNLKAEQGWNYETGIKVLDDNKLYKLAIYHMDFKDKFGWSGASNLGPDGKQYVINSGDFRNTGIEAEFKNQVDDNWSYQVGVGFSNPELDEKKGAGYQQTSARIDGMIGVTYSKDRLDSTLTFKYLGDRENGYTTKETIPSRKRLTWNTSYDFTENDTVTLTLNNLLDRENWSNKYANLDLPFNWRLAYTHTF